MALQEAMKPSVCKPWLKYLPKESLEAEMPKQTIYEYIKDTCEKDPAGKALYYYGTSITYGEMLQKIDECAAAFWGMGVRAGDMVSLVTVTLIESIYALYALAKIGAISNYIDPRMDVQRILDEVQGVNSRLLVTLDLAYPKIDRIMDQLDVSRIVVMSANDSLPGIAKLVRGLTTKKTKIPYSDSIITWKQMLRFAKGQNVVQQPFEEGSVATITYTGGTTGTPKGVMLTNDGLNTMAESFRLAGVDRKPGDRFLEIMPIFASYGVGCGIHMPLALQMEDIVIPKFSPDELGGMVKKYRINHMMGVPDFYEKLMHSKDLWDVDLSFLKTTGCGGDTMNPGLEERFNKFMKEHNAPYALSQGYGMSEMTGAATCCYSAITRNDSSGIPLLATTVGIFDPDTGEELGYNQEGEICMTGRNMMKGYYGDPEETDKVLRLHDDGRLWVHSGDIGVIDEDGFIFIRGRIKQIIIKFDGHKVFPVQIESIINRHKAVGTCAVVGIPDPDHAQGYVPLGIVELKSTLDNEADKEIIRKEIMALCDELLEERGKPSDVVIVDEMMHTALSKHDYRGLTETYKDHQIKPWK